MHVSVVAVSVSYLPTVVHYNFFIGIAYGALDMYFCWTLRVINVLLFE